jgi:hypothetical protein
MRRRSASPSITTISATVTTAPTKASGTTRHPLESASHTMKSRLLSATRMARSRGTSRTSMRRPCTSNARCTRNPSTCSYSTSPSARPSTRLSPTSTARGRRRSMMREKSQGHKVSKTPKIHQGHLWRQQRLPNQARAEAYSVHDPIYRAGHIAASEIRRSPDLFLPRQSMDQLFRARKVPARSGPCSGGLTAHPCTYRRRERPQPTFHEYIEEDGAKHIQDAHPQ